MFERYTETARKVIFYGRYAASQFGGEYIDTQHLLLGVLRADPPLAQRVFKTRDVVESVRGQIEKQFPPREKTSTSMDLPLSHECRRALAHAAGEAQRLNHQHISTEHLLLGLLLKQDCAASKIMTENGVTVALIEEVAENSEPAATPDSARSESGPVLVPSAIDAVLKAPKAVMSSDVLRDLTLAAASGMLSPLIGRERELESMMRILSRRTRCNPVLIGEPGVGKDALVQGLAQRIADGDVPACLEGRRIVALDASSLLAAANKGRIPAISSQPNVILYVHGLFDLAGKGAGWGAIEALHVLAPYLDNAGTRDRLQCIGTGTPLGFRATAEKAEALARHFEAVPAPPPSEEETIRIMAGVKQQYELFHGVVISDGAIEAAVAASRWFLRHQQLPDRAIDLIDEAGARVNLRCEGEPREVTESEKRIRRIVRDMEKAIANHDFEKARAYSAEEREERQKLHSLSAEPATGRSNIVTADDIVETVAGRAGLTPSVVKNVMQVKDAASLDLVASGLAAQIPAGGREWADVLVAWLAGCSADEADRLALAIKAAKSGLDAR